jgi:acetylornithine deacetylase/succinyl-diaminopimelate desuccinylase-like protein
MDLQRLTAAIAKTWDDSIVERLIAYVRIPNKSPMFDAQWERNGHMEAAVKLMAQWCRAQPLPGARVEVRRIAGRTPVLLVDVPGELPGCTLLYGHLDKQPEFTGWLPGLGPWEPVLRDGKLYGRGAADDGYAVFSSITAIAALKQQQVRLPRCVVLIEACGIVPTPFRILEQLLARIESPVTGDLLLDELHVSMPRDRRAQASAAAQVLAESVAGKLPWAQGVQPLCNDPTELIINNTWRATLAVTGADGLPPLDSAGNVLLPELAVKLSLRLPPTCDAARAAAAVREALERDPPYGAQVSFEAGSGSATGGWNAPALAPWLEESIGRASHAVYGRDAVYIGCGGTIPFMGMLGERFPQTQFFITGVLGPHANAHGPNEFLHLAYARQLTACVSLVLADHARTLAT